MVMRPGEDARVRDGLDEGHDGPDKDDEHHRVLDLHPRIELLERVNPGLGEDLAVEKAARLGDAVRHRRASARRGHGAVWLHRFGLRGGH